MEAEVQAAEDVHAIKRLQRAYGYYVDKGMWEDLSSFFTNDAVGNYPAGVLVGRESLRKNLIMNENAECNVVLKSCSRKLQIGPATAGKRCRIISPKALYSPNCSILLRLQSL